MKQEFTVQEIIDSIENPELIFEQDLDDELTCMFLNHQLGFDHLVKNGWV